MSEGETKARQPRTSLDDPQVVDELCARIAEGNGIYKVCEAPDMPDERAVYRRMASDEGFSRRIARARAAQTDAMTDKNNKLADEATAENWQVKRLQIWTNQWTAAKLAPKKYGDVKQLQHSGRIGVFDPGQLPDEQLAALESALGDPAATGRDAPDGEGGDSPEGREPEA